MIASSTIGSSKSQVVLAQILQKENNPKLTSVIMSRLQDFKMGCQEIEKLDKYAETFLRLWRDDSLAKMHDRTDVPEECMKFWENCLHIEYKKALESIQWKKVVKEEGKGWRQIRKRMRNAQKTH